MADSRIILEVVAEGKGVKIVQRDVENLAKSSNKAASSIGQVGVRSRGAVKQMKGVAQISANTTKNFAKTTSGITGGLVPAYAALAANIFAITAAFNFLKSAGNLATLEKGQIAYASATGVAMRTLAKDLQEATRGQLDFAEASQAGAIGIASGLSTDQVTKLGEAALATSNILGRDLTDSLNRLVRGITKAEPELLDELGIVLRLDEATRNYKDALGITNRELTLAEKSQAVYNEVLSQAEAKYMSILEITGTTTNAFERLGKSVNKIVDDGL